MGNKVHDQPNTYRIGSDKEIVRLTLKQTTKLNDVLKQYKGLLKKPNICHPIERLIIRFQLKQLE